MAEPPPDCYICPRLVGFRAKNRAAHPGWFNGPVPSFGDPDARLLIVGLAPGLQGANRTGRPFTGDFAGVLLYHTLIEMGFAHGTYGAAPGDGLRLEGCMITNAVRCVPPANKPTAAEIKACRGFLAARIAALPRLQGVLALGRIAHESVVAALGMRQAEHRFAHGGRHRLKRRAKKLEPVFRKPGATPKKLRAPDDPDLSPDAVVDGLTLYDSYHCSRYNTNTGRLTEQMFREVFIHIRADLDAGPAAR